MLTLTLDVTELNKRELTISMSFSFANTNDILTACFTLPQTSWFTNSRLYAQRYKNLHSINFH